MQTGRVLVGLVVGALAASACQSSGGPGRSEEVEVPALRGLGPSSRSRLPSPIDDVTVTAGPGRLHVAFTAPEATVADRYGVHVAPEDVTVTTVRRDALVTGLSPDADHTVTVSAYAGLRVIGTATARSVPRPTAPVSYRLPLGDDAVVVSQSVSFHPAAGTNTSWRPALHDVDIPSAGVPAGRAWELLWLRATNCGTTARPVTFVVGDGPRLRTFLHPGEPSSRSSDPRSVPPGGTLAWIGRPEQPTVLHAGERVGVRWYGMAASTTRRCDWQYAALERPAGTPARARPTGAPRQLLRRSGHGDADGRYVTRVAVPDDRVWHLDRVRVRACRTGEVALFLASSGGMAFGALPLQADGLAAAHVGAGRWVTWEAPPGGLLVPPGFAVGASVTPSRTGPADGTCVLEADGWEGERDTGGGPG